MFKIGNKIINQSNKPYIIAEACINHEGNIEKAKKMVVNAAKAGASAIKFQMHILEDEMLKVTPKSKNFDESLYDTLDRTNLNIKQHIYLKNYCKKYKIDYLCTPFSRKSADILHKEVRVNVFKVGSGELTNLPLQLHIAKKKLPTIISTGMSTEEEINACVESCSPDVIFHTNSTYPSPVSELNLSYITWLKDKYPHSVIGYSGHEYGLVPTFVSVVMGAKYVERHITLDRTLWGSDQMASVEPAGLIKMIKGIRDIEASIGTGGPRQLLEGEESKRKSLRK